jgi:hypothetical protein
MTYQLPFEARGVQDFPVHPIEVGVEYTVLDVNEDGSRFQARLPDGTLAWFPSKLVRIVQDTRTPQRAQQTSYTNKSPTYQTNNSYETSTQREHEAAKRAAAEKERRRAELKQKLKQQTNTPVRRVENDIDDDEVDEATRQLERMKTYTETRGYLSNASGFNSDLTQYIEDEDAPKSPQHIQTVPVKATQTNTLSSPAYRKVEERSDGPKYVPSDDIPDQYSNTPWKCHSCQTTNGAGSSKCNMCGTLRGERSIAVEDGALPGVDWKCSSCKVDNPPSRGTCVMCGTKYKPQTSNQTPKSKDGNKDKKSQAGNVKKKNIVTKAGSGVELQYAKGVDNYKTGGIIPGHGAGY